MTKRMGVLRNQKGFTLIEIIAVLVILGVLAAVAIPKYMDMQTESKRQAALGQVAEIKGTLNSAYAKLMMQNNGVIPTGAAVVTAAAWTPGAGGAGSFTIGTAPDIWNFTAVGAAAGPLVTIAVSDRNGDNVFSTPAAPPITWNVPQ